MERIGRAASKIAKGNLLVYNVIVITLVMLISVLMFVIAGTVILVGLMLIGYVFHDMLPNEWSARWWDIVQICLGGLTLAISLVSAAALWKNCRFKS